MQSGTVFYCAARRSVPRAVKQASWTLTMGLGTRCGLPALRLPFARTLRQERWGMMTCQLVNKRVILQGTRKIGLDEFETALPLLAQERGCRCVTVDCCSSHMPCC